MANRKKTFLSGISFSKKVYYESAIFLGLLTALLFLYLLISFSHIDISSDAPLNPSDPFSTPFIITNIEGFTIKDVYFMCFIRNAKDSNQNTIIGELDYTPALDNIGDMEVGKRTFVICRQSWIEKEIIDADIAILICYRPYFMPWFLHWKRQEIWRFITVRNSENKLLWKPYNTEKSFWTELLKVFSDCKINVGATREDMEKFFK